MNKFDWKCALFGIFFSNYVVGQKSTEPSKLMIPSILESQLQIIDETAKDEKELDLKQEKTVHISKLYDDWDDDWSDDDFDIPEAPNIEDEMDPDLKKTFEA